MNPIRERRGRLKNLESKAAFFPPISFFFSFERPTKDEQEEGGQSLIIPITSGSETREER